MRHSMTVCIRRGIAWGAVAVCVTLTAMGCATTGNVVVLMPDPDGSLGSAQVTNAGGSSNLTQSGDSTTLKSASAAPSAPKPMSDAAIQKIFAPALAAEPAPPLKFLIYFNRDSAIPDAASQETIKAVLAGIKDRDSRDISVVGHTDRSGDDAYNLKLSIERATRIRDLLVQAGVPNALIEVISHGEGNPLVATADDVEEPRNRRVEVVVR